MADPKPHPKEHPTSLGLRSLHTCAAVFQVRGTQGPESELHIKNLCRALARGETLDPITIWWGGRGWIVIDGHHRLTAYRKHGKAIPVRVFSGDLDGARLVALGGNSKDKLPMKMGEKLDAAWRHTCTSGLSAARIAKAAGISERMVKYMRAARTCILTQRGKDEAAAEAASGNPLEYHEALQGQSSGEGMLGSQATRRWAHLSELSWTQARGMAQGQTDVADFDRDAHHAAQAAEDAKKLRKVFGPTGFRDPERIARAAEAFHPRVKAALLQIYGDAEGALQEAIDDGVEKVTRHWPWITQDTTKAEGDFPVAVWLPPEGEPEDF